MYKYIFKQWQKRKVTFFLIVFGFFIGSIVVSIGISNCCEVFQQIQDRRMGSPDKQLLCDIVSEDTVNLDGISKMMNGFSEYGEVQILNINDSVFDNDSKKYAVVPVKLKNKLVWHIPIIEGNYFDVKSIKSGRKEVIIGKSIAKAKNIACGDVISITGDSYKVIGISGRENRETSWEHAVYVLYDQYYKRLDQLNAKQYSLWISCGKKEILDDQVKYLEIFNDDVVISFHNCDEPERSSFDNSIKIAVISSVLVFLVAIINIVQLLLYWVVDRKRDFGIMKALGAGKKYIIFSMVSETLLLALIGSLFAILLQWIIGNVFSSQISSLGITMRVNMISFVSSCAITMVFGLTAVIAPIKKALSTDPVQIINHI